MNEHYMYVNILLSHIFMCNIILTLEKKLTVKMSFSKETCL